MLTNPKERPISKIFSHTCKGNSQGELGVGVDEMSTEFQDARMKVFLIVNSITFHHKPFTDIFYLFCNCLKKPEGVR